MSDRFEQLLGRVAEALVEASTARPRSVLALCLLVTAVAGQQAAYRLAVDTDPDLMTSAELPFRKTNAKIRSAFPDLQDNLVVLVDAESDEHARSAVEELTRLLEREPEQFPRLFLPGDDPFYEDNGLYYLEREELERLAERIDRSGPLLATLAENSEMPVLIGAVTRVIGGSEGLNSLREDGRRILDDVSRAVEHFNRGQHAPIAWSDLLLEDLAVEYANPQVLFVQPSRDLSRLEPALEAIRAVRRLARQLEPRPGLRVRVTGDRAVHTEEMSMVLGEVALAGAASLLLVTGILFYALRSFRLLVATVLTLLVGLVWTAGFAGVAVGHLNVLTAAFGVLYIGLGVDFGIHFAMGYREQRALSRPPRDALCVAGRNVGSALFFCALTTAIGFYAFIPTSYAAIAELGIISGTGIFLSLLATLTCYPALTRLGLGESPKLTAPPKRRDGTGSSRLSRLLRTEAGLPNFPIRHPRAVCCLALVFTLAAAATLGRLRFDMDPLNVRDPRVESVRAMEDLLANGEVSAWTIEALAADVAAARRLADRLQALPGVRRVYTVESFLPDDQPGRLALFEQMRKALSSPVKLGADERGVGRDPADDMRWTIAGYGVALDLDAELRGDAGGDDPTVASAQRLRDALEALETRLLEAERGAAEPPDLAALERDVFGDLSSVIEEIKDALPTRPISTADLPRSLARRYLVPDGRARVEIFSSDNLHRPGALERFVEAVQSVSPDVGGPAVATVEFGRAIVASLRQALLTAVVVIAALLLLLWRSPKYALITMTPLLIGAVATAAFTVVTDLPFNFANVIVLPLILGIGVDSGIHLVHRHRTGLLGARNILNTATARAVLFSAMTTLVSFTTLTLSNHLGISSLAQLLTVGIGLMLIANVVVLPAILTWIDGKP